MAGRFKLHHSESFYLKILFQKVKVSEVMTSPVISIRVNAPFHEVSDLFKKHQIRHLPIVDHEGKLKGLVSERDLFRIHSPQRLDDGSWFYDKDMLDGFILSSVMKTNPVALHPDDSLAEALSLMARFKIGCIPIIDAEGKLCGILTQVDLLEIADQIISE